MVEAYEKVVEDIKKQGLYTGMSPMINDWYKGEPQFVGFTENSRKIPLMVGSVFGEFAFMPLTFDKTKMTEEEMRAKVAEVFGDKADKLQEQIFKAVMNFARTGDPNHDELPAWEASKPGDEATMIFDRTCECRHNFDGELVDLHSSIIPKFMFGGDVEIQH